MSQRCPDCKGTGTVHVTVHTDSRIDEMDLTCVTCSGRKTVPDATAAAYRAFQDSWCKCPKPGVGVYYSDGARLDCRKHHYRCSLCDGILQIG